MSLLAFGLSHASDLVLFVLKTVMLIDRDGYIWLHLGGGSKFASGQMCYCELLWGFDLKT